MIKILTYNINSLMAPERLEILDYILKRQDLDVICLQEVKTDNIVLINSLPYKASNTTAHRAGVATYSKMPIITHKVPKIFKGRLLITYNRKYVIFNLYAHYGRATKNHTQEVVMCQKITLYRYIYKTVKRLGQVRQDWKIIVTGDYNLVVADENSKKGIVPITDRNFALPPMKRLWGLFVALKMKIGNFMQPNHPYDNKTIISYMDQSGDTIDYCLVKNGFPRLVRSFYSCRARPNSSDHIPLLFKIH